MSKRLVLFVALFVLCVGFAPQVALSNPPPLPPLPPQAVIDTVLAQTGGATFTPLGVSSSVTAQLSTFTGAFAGVQNLLNNAQAVHYISTSGSLLETVIPRLDSRTTTLFPDMTAPGAEVRPGKIVGAVHQPSRGVMVVVVVFQGGCSAPRNCHPDKIRFYHTSDQYYEYSGIWAQFFDNNGDQLVETVDEGAAIAHKVSCITVGLQQACWEPYGYDYVREQPYPKDLAYAAYTRFKDLYDLQVDFFVDDAVPDLLGPTRRNGCAAQLASASVFSGLSACIPNVVFSAAKQLRAAQPIAIFVVREAIDVRAYTAAGAYTGVLPAGEYLVLDATPSVNLPGSPTLSYLVNADTVNHYLIPSVRMQGFGVNGAYDNRQAGIRDGFASYQGWGG